jgi:predicted HicB family RNase H-like nuclease
MAQINVRLDEEVARRFGTVAAARGMSQRQAVKEALVAWTNAYLDTAKALVGQPIQPEPQR